MNQKSISHRDIKPQNLLINSKTGILKICDLGSAKQLNPKEPNVSYICSRFYRAPELIFGVQYYTTKIDIWSLGCVLGECVTGNPIFEGESSLDQIVEIIRILGTPTKEDILSMNEEYLNFNFPDKKVLPWKEFFEGKGIKVPDDFIDLLEKILVYNPNKRISALDILSHKFFDELRDKNTTLLDGSKLPDLFDFKENEEFDESISEESKKLLKNIN